MTQPFIERGQASPLASNRLLAALPPNVIGALLRRGDPIDLKRGTVLYESEAKLTYCCFPLSGVIALVAILDDGRSAEVAVFGPESVVAYIGAMLGAQAFGRYVVQVSGRAFKISTRALLEVIGAHPELERRLRAFLIAFTRQTFQYLACNACHPVDQRCCKWLLTMADKAQTDEVPITHDNLAEMLGVQRPTVSIIMRELQAAGLVEQKRGCIRLLDRRRLLRCSCECYEKAKAVYDKWLPGAYPELLTVTRWDGGIPN
jgi:CRP-like cAMP-binding protein